ncbi:MAG: hypothetical protein HRF49_06435 [bacterium]|jgi:hypothetical protein
MNGKLIGKIADEIAAKMVAFISGQNSQSDLAFAFAGNIAAPKTANPMQVARMQLNKLAATFSGDCGQGDYIAPCIVTASYDFCNCTDTSSPWAEAVYELCTSHAFQHACSLAHPYSCDAFKCIGSFECTAQFKGCLQAFYQDCTGGDHTCPSGVSQFHCDSTSNNFQCSEYSCSPGSNFNCEPTGMFACWTNYTSTCPEDYDTESPCDDTAYFKCIETFTCGGDEESSYTCDPPGSFACATGSGGDGFDCENLYYCGSGSLDCDTEFGPCHLDYYNRCTEEY